MTEVFLKIAIHIDMPQRNGKILWWTSKSEGSDKIKKNIISKSDVNSLMEKVGGNQSEWSICISYLRLI